MPVPLCLYGPSFWIGKAISALAVMLLQEDRLDSLVEELSILLCVDEHPLHTAHFFHLLFPIQPPYFTVYSVCRI
jgi:hypothetical protein